MNRETEKAIENAIIAAHLRLAYKIIKIAIRDKDQALFCSEGFLWLLMVIGCEPMDLERVAGRIAMQAAGPQ